MNNLYDFFQSYCDKYSDRVLFVKEKITYAEAFALAQQRAAFMQAEGLRPGDVVGVLAVNSASWVITYMALAISGIYALLLDTNLTEPLYNEMLSIVKAKAVFTSEDFAALQLNCKTYNCYIRQNLAEAAAYVQPLLDRETIASLSFTSGTTGNAKVVPLTHANVWRTSEVTAERFGPNYYNKAVYGILPIYHVYGMVCSVTAAFVAGSRIVFQASIKPAEIIRDMQEYKVNVFPAVPRIWESFLERITKKVKDEHGAWGLFCMEHGKMLQLLGLGFILKKVFRSVQDLFGGEMLFFISGGAALKKEHQQAYVNMGFKIAPGYGLTETVGPIVVSEVATKKLGSVGKATTGNMMQIRKANAEGVGEVWLKGESVFSGYYNNQEATKAVFDVDGWFNSGDLGFIDRDGDLHLCGRKKNVIVLDSGKNVYPEDIVAYYKKSPLIAEISVFGRMIENKEIVYAVIVPESKDKDAYSRIDQELRKIGHGLPTYKRIGRFAISYDVFPKTSTQKTKDYEIIKNLDKGLYQTSLDDPNFIVKELVGTIPEEDRIIALLREKLKIDILYVNQKFEDFDMDSLDQINLISTLENTLRIKIDTEVFLEAKNMYDVVMYVASLYMPKGEAKSVGEDIRQGLIKTPLTLVYNPFLEFCFFVMRLLSRLFWRVSVQNASLLAQKNKIIIANHQSYLDALWLFSFIPRKLRKDLYIAVNKSFSFWRFLLPGFNFIFVDREGNDFIPILKAEADILRQGKSLIVFPEGTRTVSGKLRPFRTGAAFLAKNLNIELLPITINGSYTIWPRRNRLPKLYTRQRSTLVVHDCIDPNPFITIEELNKEMAKVIVSGLKIGK